ncbi:type II toxin-antitoxin system CcdA family antitoxin [Xenorhabdus doucetiae]|uniref:Antitoxin CcdA n=1 Tax=Xenorhabdus doucetiae TaxID=351671 RepID=A0A068QN57_9GAMM|nr:type II toxin-antitoxin system CcdA family antitoxin [Xenorhabdus doucetiae]TYP03180.1 antitoxin CcdA [Xenorhabdus doucetiae]CDG16387.1 CcdA-like protein (CcdAB toxin-antitoxin system) [Xenorhabdus doucetiae]
MKKQYVSTIGKKRVGKRSTHVYLTSEIVDEARELGINLSATLDKILSDVVREKRREQWKAQNKAGIHAFNQFEKEAGLFTDDDEYGVI